MSSHEHARDLQLLDDAIHALRAYTVSRASSQPSPDGPDQSARLPWIRS